MDNLFIFIPFMRILPNSVFFIFNLHFSYVVEVELGRGRGAAAWVQGFVYVSLFGDRGEIIRQKVHTDTK